MGGKTRVSEEPSSQGSGADGQEAREERDVGREHDALLREVVTGPLRRLFAPQVARYAVRDDAVVLSFRSTRPFTGPLPAPRLYVGI